MAVVSGSREELKLLATAGTEKGGEADAESVVRVWDLESLKLRYTHLVPATAVTSLSYDRDGTRLLAGDDKGGVTGWNLKAQDERPHSVDSSAPVVQVLFSPVRDGAVVASDRLYVWNPDPNQQADKSPFPARQVAGIDFGFGGAQLAASGGRETVIVNPETFEVTQGFRFAHAQPVTAVALTQGYRGLYMASGHSNGTVELWFAGQRRRLVTFLAHKGAVTGVVFYGDDRRLITTGTDGMIRFWDAKTLEQLYAVRDFRSAIVCFAVTADRGQLVTSDGESVHLRKIDPQHPGQVTDERTLNPFSALPDQSED